MSMCKLHTVKSARKPQGTCGKCGAAIPEGEPYRWWKGRYTSKRVRCMQPSCTPEPWERETNPLRADHMQAEAALSAVQGFAAGDDFGSMEEVLDPLQTAIDYAQSVVEALQERVASWEGTNLANSYQAEACQTSADDLEGWITDAEGVSGELQQLEDGSTSDVEDVLANLPDLPELDLGA